MGRLFVCDPACVQSFGHNVVALKYFRDYFKADFSEVVALSCRLLPKADVDRNGFIPFFDFYYRSYLHAVDLTGYEPTPASVDDLHYPDQLEMVATRDAERLLASFEVGAQDSILFPHLDFYGVVGMINALLRTPAAERPRLHLRFIGVMENATSTYRAPLEELCARLRAALAEGVPVRVSAETPAYADHIAERLDEVVSVTGYPETGRQLPIPAEGPFVFYSPGAARHDKGFGLLREIYSEVRRRDHALSIRFVTQMLADRDQMHHMQDTAQIYALPGVELLPSHISEARMLSAYERSHAVLLPYDLETYRLRGSAVMMEAAFHGRPAITFEGTAFADQIRHYGLGVVVPDTGAMIEAMLRMAKAPRERLEQRAAQARYRFACDNAAAFRQWFALA